MCLNNTVYWISILLQSHGSNWTWAEWQTKDLVCRHPAMRSFLSRLRKNPVWHPETHPDKTGLCVKRNHIVKHDLLQYMYFEHKGVNLARDIVTSEIICMVVIWAYLAIRKLAKNIWSKERATHAISVSKFEFASWEQKRYTIFNLECHLCYTIYSYISWIELKDNMRNREHPNI